jgi:hypothetical protein
MFKRTSSSLLLVISLSFSGPVGLWAMPVLAVDQTVPGIGNKSAVDLSKKSPIIESSRLFVIQQARFIRQSSLKSATLDAIANPQTCIQHRAGVTESVKATILQNLQTAGLVDTSDNTTFPGGLKAGVFPPVLYDGSSCPQLAQTFFSAPGSNFGGHHSYPGGLVVHEAFNTQNDLSLAKTYRQIYGYSGINGLPRVRLTDEPDDEKKNEHDDEKSDIFISQDVIIAAPIWHDWAKSIVFQWNSDGTEFIELNFGGNGLTDNYGAPGNSKTGGHHIIGLAESMKRGLPPDFVITQASAHSAPTLGNEYKVVNWIRAAAIMAQIDPVAAGYLFIDSTGNLRLPPLRQLGSINLTEASPSQTNLLVEYTTHNLSDADFTFSIPAVTDVQILLQTIAPLYGYNPSDVNYNNKFRNPVLTYLTAERLLIIYGNSGINGVTTEVNKLRTRGII